MKNKDNYKKYEIQFIKKIIDKIYDKEIKDSIILFKKLKDKIYSDIPDNYRISRGITWVLARISNLIYEKVEDKNILKKIALLLYANLDKSDRLQGVPIFLMSYYGINNPVDVFDFFIEIVSSDQWEVREFAALGFKRIIKNNKQIIANWFLKIVHDDNPNIRRFVSETLRPVSENRWLQKEPDYSIEILKSLFKERHKYPRTSVGNNLSDLSKKNPELILKIVKELVEMNNENSYWIAYRSCRNLIKIFPDRVMDILKVDEYHYKDRNFYRVKT